MYSEKELLCNFENCKNNQHELKDIDDFIKEILNYNNEYYNQLIEEYDKKFELEQDELKIKEYVEELIQINKVYFKNLEITSVKFINNEIKIKIPSEFEYEINDHLIEYNKLFLCNYNSKAQLVDNIISRILHSIEYKKLIIIEIIYKLKKIPYIYINKKNEFINDNLILNPYNPRIIYKDIYIKEDMHYKLLFYNNNTNNQDKIDLVNILAFLYCKPMFIYLGNINYSKKLANIYEECNEMETLRMRNKNYLRNDYGSYNLQQKVPILKNDKRLSAIKINDINDEEILELFELYNSSLKQVEPLPKCVFLYRVFEKASNIHYKKVIMPKDEKYFPKDALNYYYNIAKKHRFVPIYYFDNDWDRNVDDNQRKPKLNNLMVEFKKEANKIEKQWKKSSYLSDKTIGDIIYAKGRCLAAHGGSNFNSKYDYSKSYLHINDINIFLQIICRYLIEMLVPDLKGYVMTSKKYYLSKLEKEMMKQES